MNFRNRLNCPCTEYKLAPRILAVIHQNFIFGNPDRPCNKRATLVIFVVVLYDGDSHLLKNVVGILEIIKPLEDKGMLVRRSRERLEIEIDHFLVIERDGMIIACAALYPSERNTLAELACLAVHADYQHAGRGDALLQKIEASAASAGVRKLVVLTTHTAHWFRERGFLPGDKSVLPAKKKNLYNYQRNSKVFFKLLS